ncbi:MAG: response regulator transcription factor [Mycobacterium sp.]
MKAFGSVARLTAGGDVLVGASAKHEVGSPVRHNRRRTDRGVVAAPNVVPMTPDGPENSARSPQTVVRNQLCGVRVLIVDDCMLYRDSLAAALTARGLPAIGFAWDLRTLVIAMRERSVEVILLNIATRDSAALLNVAVATDPSVRVVVLGVSEDDESGVIACAEAGVAGYHTRAESLEDLLAQIEKVVGGETMCSPRLSAILLQRLSALASQPQAAPGERILTAREVEILGMLEAGMSNREIADRLCIAVHTVKNHVHSVLTKLGVATRAEAAASARTQRIGPAGSGY